MDDLRSFIPMDRRQARAHNRSLPDRAEGAALLTDLAGFTPLTETLAATLGPQRGAEELTRLLNGVYATLIALIDHYGGSVIGFSGDALTCWFGADDGARAVTCTLALQRAMNPLTAVVMPGETAPVTLALKVAVAAGSVRRFLVGDPQVQVHDVLAGHLLDRLAAAEQQAQAGEVVLDPATAAHLAPRLCAPTGRGAAVVISGITPEAAPRPWPPLAPDLPPAEQVRPWLLPAVQARAQGDPAAARPLYEESLTINREIRSRWGVALALNNLGYINAAQGALDQAWVLLTERAALFHRLGDKRLGADSLVGLASVAAAQARPTLAARFLGAATRLLTESGATLDTLERAVFDLTHAQITAALSLTDFASAWAIGLGWSGEEAVTQAQASPHKRAA